MSSTLSNVQAFNIENNPILHKYQSMAERTHICSGLERRVSYSLCMCYIISKNTSHLITPFPVVVELKLELLVYGRDYSSWCPWHLYTWSMSILDRAINYVQGWSIVPINSQEVCVLQTKMMHMVVVAILIWLHIFACPLVSFSSSFLSLGFSFINCKVKRN